MLSFLFFLCVLLSFLPCMFFVSSFHPQVHSSFAFLILPSLLAPFLPHVHPSLSLYRSFHSCVLLFFPLMTRLFYSHVLLPVTPIPVFLHFFHLSVQVSLNSFYFVYPFSVLVFVGTP